jgi:hypothetical protein
MAILNYNKINPNLSPILHTIWYFGEGHETFLKISNKCLSITWNVKHGRRSQMVMVQGYILIWSSVY